VVETTGPVTYLGRYDREDEHGVHLLDVGLHHPESGTSKVEYIQRSARFGIRSEHGHLVVDPSQIARITQLGRWEQDLTSR
jgi:hypothetical protein